MTLYSTAQKLCLAGMVIGAILLGVGGCAPFWIITEPKGFGLWGEFIGQVVTANMGPFIYCVEVPLLDQKQCALLPWTASESFRSLDVVDVTSFGWLTVVRITLALSVTVGVLCGLCALCLACCTCCQRLIALGILAFGASACGACSGVIWYMHTDDFTQEILGFSIFSMGWAFYVFGAGVVLIGLVSFIACFAIPERSNSVHSGMVLSNQQPPTQLTIINPSAPPVHMYGPGASHPYSVPEGVTAVGPAPPGSKY